jgi:2-haloacid dehalogenase
VADERWATFDCYGTLVDWFGGVRMTLARLWPEADADLLLHRYHEIEPAVQAGRGVAYRQVMAETLAGVAESAALEIPDGESDALASGLPTWPVFPDVPGALSELRGQGWMLGILSNTDADLLQASLDAVGVAVDLRIVASEVGSYKPAFAHWEAFFERTRADRARHVHVAASLFHDVEPCARLGIPCIWINRRRETSRLPRARELADLRGLPDSLDALVPT